SVSGDVVAGFAFSSIEPSQAAATAYREIAPAPFEVDSGFLTPILKPEADLWYDLGHKVGLGVSLGYTIARPRLTIVGGGQRESLRVNADALNIGVGLVYKIF